MLSIAGIELLPPLPAFLAFVAAGLALNIVPGADMTFVIASAARGGRRNGIIASLGIGAGTLVHISAAVLGLSAILASSEMLFTIIKWIGAAYLLYIAVSLILTGRNSPNEKPTTTRQSGWRLFRAAALVNILNPKVALFFLAFLPQFIGADAPHKALAFLALGVLFNVNSVFWNLFVAWSAHHVAGGVRRGRAALWINRSIGAMFVAMGVRLALAER